MTPHQAVVHAVNYISTELGAEVGIDPVVVPNLFLCYINMAPGQRKEDWDKFLAHLCWPEENEFPEQMFLVDKDNLPGYIRLMNRLEEKYE